MSASDDGRDRGGEDEKRPGGGHRVLDEVVERVHPAHLAFRPVPASSDDQDHSPSMTTTRRSTPIPINIACPRLPRHTEN